MIDLSICLPAIRPSYWERLYNSYLKSCQKYSFEVVFIGPHDLPDSLKGKPNIKFIKSYATSVRSAMEGVLICEGRLIAIPADDGYAFPNALDQCIELRNQHGKQDVVVLRYREGEGMSGLPMAGDYWSVRGHPLLMSLEIPVEYKLFMQPLMSREYLINIGGWDCRFEHLAFASHDLSYRIQRDGGVLYLSPGEVFNYDYRFQHKGDHGPIHDSHIEHDLPLFVRLYDKPNNRTSIDFDNWKDCSEVWERRWPGGIPG